MAVPYGNCVEPSNVKAGGKKCPIRFQCAGCGFYRPDPSYLPAIEDHVRSLKADREMALAMDTDEFVVRNLADQIAAFQGVIERMRRRMEQLPDEMRAEIEEASRVLRKVRAGSGRALLPLTVLNQNGDRTMTPRPVPAEVLSEARRKDSAGKRARVLATVDAMLGRGETVTFAAVARAARVSTWLVYAVGVRENIEKARTQQALAPARDLQTGRAASSASLLTDLELSRAENRSLRQERDTLKLAVQRSLGHQLDQLANVDLVTRVEELTQAAQLLTIERDQARQENAELARKLTEAEDDLAAARTTLRRMIRSENKAVHTDT